jgi:hypothetical protein
MYRETLCKVFPNLRELDGEETKHVITSSSAVDEISLLLIPVLRKIW